MTEEVALNMLKKAIKQVGFQYISPLLDPPEVDGCCEKETSDDPHNVSEDTYVEMVERCFAYELYHQFSLLLSAYNTIADCIETEEQPPLTATALYINGEISKIWEDNKHRFPDLVVHGGPTDFEEENQIMVCEIKRFRNKGKSLSDAIMQDLDKLHFATSKGFKKEGQELPFKMGVLIIAGKDREEIKSFLDSLVWNNIDIKIPKSKKIHCLIYGGASEKNNCNNQVESGRYDIIEYPLPDPLIVGKQDKTKSKRSVRNERVVSLGKNS
ncbi:MAG: hypothetical protein K2H96_05510 [Muribaculaceae bacterium]|nr:hypothetical protein [Muribaculaceae bacterium]